MKKMLILGTVVALAAGCSSYHSHRTAQGGTSPGTYTDTGYAQNNYYGNTTTTQSGSVTTTNPDQRFVRTGVGETGYFTDAPQTTYYDYGSTPAPNTYGEAFEPSKQGAGTLALRNQGGENTPWGTAPAPGTTATTTETTTTTHRHHKHEKSNMGATGTATTTEQGAGSSSSGSIVLQPGQKIVVTSQ